MVTFFFFLYLSFMFFIICFCTLNSGSFTARCVKAVKGENMILIVQLVLEAGLIDLTKCTNRICNQIMKLQHMWPCLRLN